MAREERRGKSISYVTAPAQGKQLKVTKCSWRSVAYFFFAVALSGLENSRAGHGNRKAVVVSAYSAGRGVEETRADGGWADHVERGADEGEQTGERFNEPELYRIKDELTLQSHGQGPKAEAEAYFHKAIETAHKQRAKSLELQAATSLARLWQKWGRKDEARQMLAEIYDWFTEGFDTKDLQEAKALLEELQ
jgi:hypothetical protein